MLEGNKNLMPSKILSKLMIVTYKIQIIKSIYNFFIRHNY